MGDTTTPAGQWLLIVSTKSRALFEYLSRSFRDVPTVEVILDRRQGERRGRAARPNAERRRGDRREERDQRGRYPLLGYVLIRRNGTAPGGAQAGKRGRGQLGTDDGRTLPWPDVRSDGPRDGERPRGSRRG